MSVISLNGKPLLIALVTKPFPHTFQSIRWRRKPISLGTAKSKIFRIPQRPQASEDEQREMKRLNNNYRTHMKSIVQYLTEKYNVKYLPSSNVEQLKEEFEADFNRCTEINSKWNSEIKVLREKRIQEEIEREIQLAREKIEEQVKLEELSLQEAEEEVKLQKEAAKTFITPDKLDAAIEYAINNPVDYNYAIDLEGNKLVAGESNPSEKKTSV